MNIYMQNLRQCVLDFRDGTKGSVSMEAVLMLPLLAWAYVAMFTYFDAFRTRNTGEKAAYTISDAMTRVTDGVDENYIEGMKTLFDYLTPANYDTELRVSEIQWVLVDPNDPLSLGSYEVRWSYGADGKAKLTNSMLAGLENQLPDLVAGERLVVVEATSNWKPFFNVGLDARSFDYFIPTSPRFSSQVAWEGASTFIGDHIGNTDADGGTNQIDDDDDDDAGTGGWMGWGGWGGWGGGTSGHHGHRGWH
ncbi:MAG: TadE/TadG family type IV pilus assembly protein [Paracoccaceae bacterium]